MIGSTQGDVWSMTGRDLLEGIPYSERLDGHVQEAVHPCPNKEDAIVMVGRVSCNVTRYSTDL